MTHSDPLAGRRIVVGGGTGDVGSAIVDVLSHAGAAVFVPTRSEEKFAELRATLRQPDKVVNLGGFPADDQGVATLSKALKSEAPIDAAVASLGSWFRFGPLLETSARDFQTAFESLLASHLFFARAVFPVLKPGGSFIMLNGAASEQPVPHSAAVSVMTHGLSMLFEALAVENPRINIHMLMLRSVVATRARHNPDPSWITATEIGQAAHWLLSPTGRLTTGTVTALTPRNVRLSDPP